MLRLLLFLAISIHAASANAQTVEEEVALIVSGFEAGRAIASPCGLIQMPQVISRSPARYRFDCGNGDWTEDVYRQIDGCKFEMFFIMNGGEPDKREVLDFSKFRGLLPARGDDPRIGHFFDAGPDFCTSSDGKTCLALFLSIATGQCCVLAGEIPRERVESALSLISKSCRP